MRRPAECHSAKQQITNRLPICATPAACDFRWRYQDAPIDNRRFCGFHLAVLRCVIFEDEHLLAVNKPAGMNTHAPGPFAGEGLYEWLRNREPRWARLAIIHRLDKDTSGVIVFAKTPLANRSLTEQFTNRTVRKKYVFLTDRESREEDFIVKSSLVRAGEKYVSRPWHAGGERAETTFKVLGQVQPSGRNKHTLMVAEPITGRTHQIRVHAAE